MPSGDYTFDVAVSGSPITDAVLTVPNVSLATGSSYTVVAYNTVSSIGALLLEDLVNPIATSSVRLRAVHTAVGVGTVDILAVSESGNTPLWSQVPFGGVGDAIDVPPGVYRVGLDVDGNGQPNLVASLPALPGGTYANVFASVDAVGAASLVVQLGDGSTLNVPLLPFEAAGDALVRATFVGLQPGSVDFTFDGPETFSVAGVGENEVSEWFSVEAGTYSVNAVGGLFNVYQSSAELTLAAGDVVSVVVYATDGTIFGTGIGTAVFEDDYSALSGRSSRLRTAHLDRNVGEVDVLQLQPTAQTIATNVEIGAVGALSGAIQLGVDATGDGQADITYTSTPIPPGRSINTLVTEGDNGESEVILFTRIGELEINPDGTGP